VAFAAVETRAAGRPQVVRPDYWSQPGRSSVDILSAAARARDIHGAVCTPAPSPDAEVVPAGLCRASLSSSPMASTACGWTAICRGAAMRRGLRKSWRRATAISIARDCIASSAGQASNERLPLELRQRP
jgi:hypothetical protein